MKNVIGITVTKNTDEYNDLFLEEYEKATSDWTQEEKDMLPPSEIEFIIEKELANGFVEYELKIKE